MSKILPLQGQALDNPARLDALAESQLLDSLPEESFDRYTRIAAALLHADVSLISLVDSDRQFFKSQIGLPPPYDTTRQTPLTHSFCQLVVQGGEPLIVEDARKDDRVSQNLAVRDLGVISYLGMPVTSQEGFLLGSLCTINSHPRVWSDADQHLLADLAGTVSTEIQLRQSTALLKESLSILQDSEQQHEKSLHMLVHDLRTPAGAIVNLTELLDSLPPGLSPDQKDLLNSCRESAETLLSMIGDLLTIHGFAPWPARDGIFRDWSGLLQDGDRSAPGPHRGRGCPGRGKPFLLFSSVRPRRRPMRPSPGYFR